MNHLTDTTSCRQLATFYRDTLLQNVVPFWLKNAPDREHGGIFTALDRDGALLDTDKSVWFQGRSGWMFAALYNSVEPRPEWLELARSCVEFSRRHCFAPNGKMYFTVTREGQPLRMRRYVFSEAFAAISFAAVAKATGNEQTRSEAIDAFSNYVRYSFESGVMAPKFEPTRPAKGIGSHMIGIVTAQEMRANLGDITVSGRTCTEWIDSSIAEIERDFFKPDLGALMEIVAPDGSILDHLEGRTLNPGHAIECAWFIMREGSLRSDQRLIHLGSTILDCMWKLGWDSQYGGIALLHRPSWAASSGILARYEILVAPL